MAAWIGTVVVIALIWIWAAIKVTPQYAIGLVFLLLMLVPAWSNIELYGLPFFAYHAATIVCLSMYCFHPRSNFPIRLNVVDYFGLGWIAVHVVSDTIHDGWTFLHVARAYVEWAVPYFAGRLAFQRWSDVEKLVPIGVAASIILGIGSAMESIFGIHPFEWIHGERPFENIGRETARWGLYRAWGTRSHPIYFGNVQLMLLAFPMFAVYKALRKDWAPYWILSLIIACGGIFFTVSRAPILGVVAAFAIAISILIPKSRIPIGAATVAVLLLVVLFWPTVKDAMVQSGRIDGFRKQNALVKTDEGFVETSGSMTRWFELKLYGPAALRGGLFGYGTSNALVFPPRVGVQIADPAALKYWKFVDNSYLLMMLRFGWLGVICFAGMLAAAFVRLVLRSIASNGDVRALTAFLAASLGAMILVIGTVWPAPDYQSVLFWMLGIASVPKIMQQERQPLRRKSVQDQS